MSPPFVEFTQDGRIVTITRLQDVLELSAAFQALAHETRDHGEAIEAFFDKREPRFTGG